MYVVGCYVAWVRACVRLSVCEYIALFALQICQEFINGNKQNVKWHDEHKAPYAYNDDGIWVGYENEYSLQLKVSFKQVLLITIRVLYGFNMLSELRVVLGDIRHFIITVVYMKFKLRMFHSVILFLSGT